MLISNNVYVYLFSTFLNPTQHNLGKYILVHAPPKMQSWLQWSFSKPPTGGKDGPKVTSYFSRVYHNSTDMGHLPQKKTQTFFLAI